MNSKYRIDFNPTELINTFLLWGVTAVALILGIIFVVVVLL